GGHLATPPLPHHQAYGSVPWRFGGLSIHQLFHRRQTETTEACFGEALMQSLAVGSELLFEVFSQRYERGATLVTSNLPFDEWTSIFGSERLTGALLDRLTHHVH